MPDITMPRLSDTMEDGVIVAWRKEIGDPIAVGDVIVEVETDKAVMELEAYDDGVLERILVAAGESAPIGTPIGVIGTGDQATVESAPLTAADTCAGGSPATPTGLTGSTGPTDRAPASRPPASPLARRLARERGIDLDEVRGTGPHGRIVRADIEAAATAASRPDPVRSPAVAAAAPNEPSSPVPTGDDADDVPRTRMQQVAAARMSRSKQEAPHFYLTAAADVTDLIEFRRTLNATLAGAGQPGVSLNDLIVKTAATALRTHPGVNVSVHGDALRRHRRVNVGVAVAVPGGLLVPVVADADRKSVTAIAAETRDMSARAREGRLRPDEMTGGTFTVSNLGMYGIEQFAAVINPPEAAILAVGAATEEFRPRDGLPVVRAIVRATLSADHRALDGATGAAYLQTLVALLEDPLRILA